MRCLKQRSLLDGWSAIAKFRSPSTLLMYWTTSESHEMMQIRCLQSSLFASPECADRNATLSILRL